jgi:hypothetical protein
METVLDLVQGCGVNPGRPIGRKREHHCACPGCGGSKRFRIWPEDNNGAGSYDCRDCGKRGDNIQFCRDFLGLDFRAAAERCGRHDLLDELAGRKPKPRQAKSPSLPAAPRPIDWNPPSYNCPPEAWVAQANEFAHQCHLALIANKKLMDWLAGRGITAEAVARYSLGWNLGNGGKPLFKSRKTWGLPLEANEQGRNKPLWIPVGLVIPYLLDNQVVRLRIRRPKAERDKFLPEVKYYVVPGSFMGTMVLEPHRRAFVVIEAELDAMACAVATELCGAVSVQTLEGKPDSFAHQVLSSSLQILEALDVGDLGAASIVGKRARAWWRATYPDICERWPVPRGKDPGEAFAAGVDLGEWLTAGLPPILTVTASAPVPEKPVEVIPEVSGQSAVSSGLRKEGGNFTSPVAELRELLRETGLVVVKRERGAELGIAGGRPGLSFDLKRKVGRLIFQDPEVGAYIDQLPDGLLRPADLGQ